jgi:hypothetical protein
MTHLWEHSHPYYATQGCYYVSSILGTRDGLGGYNGSTCHIDYASSTASAVSCASMATTASGRSSRRVRPGIASLLRRTGTTPAVACPR